MNFQGKDLTKEAPASPRLRVGGQEKDTAMPRVEKLGVKDKAAFERSLEAMLQWDFERVIVGHGDVVETGKVALTEALMEADFLSTQAG